MLKNIKGAETRAKTITSIQYAINKHKKLRQKFNTWMAQRMENPEFVKLTQSEKVDEFVAHLNLVPMLFRQVVLYKLLGHWNVRHVCLVYCFRLQFQIVLLES